MGSTRTVTVTANLKHFEFKFPRVRVRVAIGHWQVPLPGPGALPLAGAHRAIVFNTGRVCTEPVTVPVAVTLCNSESSTGGGQAASVARIG